MILKNNLKLSKRFFTFLQQSTCCKTKLNLRKLETNLIRLNQLPLSKNMKIKKLPSSVLKTNSIIVVENWNTTQTNSKKLETMLRKIVKKPINDKHQNQNNLNLFYPYINLFNNLLLQSDKTVQNDNMDLLLFPYQIILKDRVKNVNKKAFSINRLTCLFFREKMYYFPFTLNVNSELVQIIQKQQYDYLTTNLTQQKNTFSTQQSSLRQSKQNTFGSGTKTLGKTTFSLFALYVFEIQGRIFKLQKYGNVNEAQILQNCFLKSWNCVANFVFLLCHCCIVSFLDAKNPSNMRFLLGSENVFLDEKKNNYFYLLEERVSLFVSNYFDFSFMDANSCLKKTKEKQKDFVLKPAFAKPFVFSQLCFCVNIEQSKTNERVKKIKLLKINRVLSSININDSNKEAYFKPMLTENQTKVGEQKNLQSFGSDKKKQKDVLLTQQIEKIILKQICKKKLLYAVMEPQWETLFHKKSFQFRPGRFFDDCLQTISKSLKTQPLFFYYIQNKICKNSSSVLCSSFLTNQTKKMPLSILTQNAHNNGNKNYLYAHINNKLMNIHKSLLLSIPYFKLNGQKNYFSFDKVDFFLKKNQIKNRKNFCFLIGKIETRGLSPNGTILPVLAFQIQNQKLDTLYIDKNLKQVPTKRNLIKNFKTDVSNQTNNLVLNKILSNISLLKTTDYLSFQIAKLDSFETLLNFSSLEQDMFTYFFKQKYKQTFCLPLSSVIFKQDIEKKLLNKQLNYFLLFNIEIIHSDNHFVFLHRNQFFLKQQIKFFTEWCQTIGLNDNLLISETNTNNNEFFPFDLWINKKKPISPFFRMKNLFPFLNLKNKFKLPEISFHFNGFLILYDVNSLKLLTTYFKNNQKTQNFKSFSFGSYLSLNQNKNEKTTYNSSFFKIKKGNANRNKKNILLKIKYIQIHRQSLTKNLSLTPKINTPLFLFSRRQSLKSIQHHFDNHFQSKITILPAKSNVREHLLELKKIIKSSKTITQEQIIERLAPVISAWCSCYQTVSNKKMFIYCDFITFKLIWRWACRRHPNKSKTWIKSKYFHTLNNKTWVFGVYKKSTGALICLPSHKQTKLLKCVEILENYFPYDEHWKKWIKRCAFETFINRFKIKLYKNLIKI